MEVEEKQASATRIIFSSEARKQLLEGLTEAANAVTTTLGPRGKTVLIQREGKSPLVTKDGVTVSRSIRFKDPVKRMGAELIREAASQTNDEAGDGTTTATVLTYSLVKEGLKLLEAGFSAKELCLGITQAVAAVDAILVEKAVRLTTMKEIAQVATVSANGDSQMGDIIAKAMSLVGTDGVITVDDAKGTTTTLETAEGMKIERGYLSPYFVNNQEKMQCVYDESFLLVTDKKLSNLRELIPTLEYCVSQKRPLLIIAEDAEAEALQGLVLNRVKAQMAVCVIKAPGYGQHKIELLQDICVMTGAKLVSASTGVTLEDSKNALGKVKRFIVDAKGTTLVAPSSTRTAIEERVNELRTQLTDVTISIETMEKLRMRVAKLSKGIATIRVGGATEVEMIERKHRIEDALNATRAAAAEGIVPGGGAALARAGLSLKKVDIVDENIWSGWTIVREACLAPIRKIATNASMSPDLVLNQLVKAPETYGHNAVTGEVVDMLDAGIIDPCRVTRCALKNAASIATTFLQLDAVIVNE
jgi:chaperonin GroEL